MTIGYRIQQLRKEMGMTQENLASSLNVSRQAVSKWESDQSLPDLDNFILLSEYLNTTTDYLLKGTPMPSSKEEDNIIPEALAIKQESTTSAKSTPSSILLISTAINLIGFLIFTVFYLNQSSTLGSLIGIIVMILGTVFFGIQIHTVDLEMKYTIKRNFGMINVWFLSFPPIIVIISRYFSLISYLIVDKLFRNGINIRFIKIPYANILIRNDFLFPLFCYLFFCFLYCIISYIYYKRKRKKDYRVGATIPQ